ncbi:DMT family transporter [Streptomonospora litoralis]|uniref:EamA-like transporter family protein n=1 Tax=Streptomonospora litoralis TaxID=2498135 RepID=A0A4P6Q4F9_9ACTN|nr:DMT family transporter [Streptomonospora litoralis]QBI55586.1 EamA-like transporter family protein [Streptomonospora litoralis]
MSDFLSDSCASSDSASSASHADVNRSPAPENRTAPSAESASFAAGRQGPRREHSAGTGRGFALLVTAGLLWGTSGIAGHGLQAAGVPVLGIACYRLLFAGVVIGGFLALSGRLARLPRSRPLMVRLLVNGVLHAVFQCCYFASLTLIPVGLATLVKIGSVPVFVAVGICLLSRRAPTARLAVSVLLAVAGMALLVGFPATDASGTELALGMAFALGAGLTFSVMTLVNRSPVPGLDPLANAGTGLLIGGVLLLPLGLAAGMAVPMAPGPLATLAYLGLVPTVLAYLAYFGGVSRSSDAGAAVGTLAEPLTAALLSMALLDEEMTPLGAAGAVLLTAAMATDYTAGVLDRLRKRRRRRGR